MQEIEFAVQGGPDGDAAPARPPVAAFRKARARPLLLVCGELHNLGDLALLVQNLEVARKVGRQAFVRCWSPIPRSAHDLIKQYDAKCLNGRHLPRFLRKAAACDFVIGGGQLVRQNMGLASLVWLWLGVMISVLFAGRIETRGLGVGPVTGLRQKLWRSILRKTGEVRVRDETSAANVRELVPTDWVEVTGDMAFYGDSLVAIADPAPRDASVVVAPCVDGSEGRAIDAALLGSLRWSLEKTFLGTPLVMACHDTRPEMDSAAAAALAAEGRFDAELVGSGESLPGLLALYRNAAIVITNRLHSGIFAILFERPLLVLDDGNPKLAVLAETFGVPTLRLGEAVSARDISTAIDAAVNFDVASRRAARQDMARRAARNVDKHRIAIFNVKYSPNLGDGIIAECFERELRRARTDIEPHSVDLAGRASFDRSHGKHRRLVLALRERLSERARSWLMPIALGLVVRFRMAPRWWRALAATDCAIIGGGALFADADQNFPIKLSQALDLCRKRRLPTAIACVGVTADWSRQGRRRVIDRLRAVNLVSVTTRDRPSAGAWEHEFGRRGLRRATVAPDPGLLCVDHYPVPGFAGSEGQTISLKPRIGICITDPMVLRLHDEGTHDTGQLEAWFTAAAERLGQRSAQVVLFTNGSPEDEKFRRQIAKNLEHLSFVEQAPEFSVPEQLARFIAGLDCVLAHRLHACIAAYSYRIPAIGFAWDRKLAHFFAATGRDRYIIDPREMSPGELADMAFEAIANPPDAQTHERLLAECRKGIATLADTLVGAAQ